MATENAIVPGMHSADICCSLMMTVVDNVEPPELLNAVFAVTHFGPGGRARGQQIELTPDLKNAMLDNHYLNSMVSIAQEHLIHRPFSFNNA